jgi:hypothetical protein
MAIMGNKTMSYSMDKDSKALTDLVTQTDFLELVELDKDWFL